MEYFAGSYDVIVIGAGHAGIEACLAAARLGVKTAVFTINLDWVGNMPCNPSIGGTSKGHLVREIDALGGEMGKAADKYTLQSRMLNLGKGPAVHSLRAQIDRREYSQGMKHTLELQENLDIRQGEIVDLYRLENGEWQVKTKLEALFNAWHIAVLIEPASLVGHAKDDAHRTEEVRHKEGQQPGQVFRTQRAKDVNAESDIADATGHIEKMRRQLSDAERNADDRDDDNG